MFGLIKAGPPEIRAIGLNAVKFRQKDTGRKCPVKKIEPLVAGVFFIILQHGGVADFGQFYAIYQAHGSRAVDRDLRDPGPRAVHAASGPGHRGGKNPLRCVRYRGRVILIAPDEEQNKNQYKNAQTYRLVFHSKYLALRRKRDA